MGKPVSLTRDDTRLGLLPFDTLASSKISVVIRFRAVPISLMLLKGS
jgi:hypothetical protein